MLELGRRARLCVVVVEQGREPEPRHRREIRTVERVAVRGAGADRDLGVVVVEDGSSAQPVGDEPRVSPLGGFAGAISAWEDRNMLPNMLFRVAQALGR